MRTIPRTLLLTLLTLLAATQMGLPQDGERPGRDQTGVTPDRRGPALDPSAQPEDTRPPDDFDRYVLKRMEEARIPGATVLVAHRGEKVKSRGYGIANLEWEGPASQETVYEIASITKLFTTVAAMMLVEEGALELDGPISRYIEDVPETHAGISVRHLLTHTSGLPTSHYDSRKLFGPAPLRYTVEEQLADLWAEPLEAEPGTSFGYGSAAMFLLGALVAEVSRMPYEEFVRSRIFEPVGMAHSSFVDASAVIPERAQGYTLRDGELARWSVEQNAQALDGNSYGGILSTAPDMHRFHEALRSGRLIAPETQRRMLEPHRLPDGSYGRGSVSRMALGWWVRDDLGRGRCGSHLGHTGGAFYHCPDDEFAVVFLSNLTQGYDFMGDRGVSESLRHDVAVRAAEIYLKGGQRH